MNPPEKPVTAPFPFHNMVKLLKAFLGGTVPVVTKIARSGRRDPFLVLVGTLLSLRTKDEVTEEVMGRLFIRATTPQEILAIPAEDLECVIYPVGFYRNKARTLREVSRIILENYQGRVPDTIEELLSIRGVGRKTANLVVAEGYGKPGICVDTHVHRISNRMGIVTTKHPHETEMVLREILPKRYWIIYNTLLVTFGKTVCKPLSPLCTRCPLSQLCKRIGVDRYR